MFVLLLPAVADAIEYTPENQHNMEHKNHPIEKENHEGSTAVQPVSP